jgi:hypothetical protein
MVRVSGGAGERWLRVNYSSPLPGVANTVVCMRTSVPGSTYVNCASYDEDTAGFSAGVYRSDGSDCIVDYFAVTNRY